MKLKILVTCGPTWVPIDQVRVISNASTGLMGHAIADAFIKQGASVTLLEGPVTHVWYNAKVQVVKYCFFDELSFQFKRLLKQRFDAVIHAAAVSDYKVMNASNVKLDSSTALTLRLTATPKLIEWVKKVSPQSFLVSFKLESSLTKAVSEAKRQIKHLNGDLVVANCSGKRYAAWLIDRRGQVMLKTVDKKVLANQLAEIVTYHLKFIK